MASEKKASLSNAGVWAMNVISSVGIIMVNKQVMSGYNFRFATTLTGLHFLVTALVGFISQTLGYSSSNKQIPFWELFWFSIVGNMSIVGMNLSLMLNSVGFYQISKLSMIPVVCVMEWILHSKQYSKEVKTTVFLVIMGVAVCTVTDVKVNAKGFIAAIVAVFSSSLQQISIGSLHQKHNIGSFDLLSKTAPIQSALLLLPGPVIDYCLNGYNLLEYKFSYGATLFITLSCGLAVFCNLSQYLCIGRFSAVSFQVLGHMKTVCVLILGWILFDSELTLKNLIGIAIAVGGMIMYNWAMENSKQCGSKLMPIVTAEGNDFDDEKESMLKSGFQLQPVIDIDFGEETKLDVSSSPRY
ncbi:hypothetical protein SUGI_0872750 [Cryptomeria japonica]|uniref:UDP-rhamnose/UDP-galactose transporter 3 n=1 Tax=Cryptomeria japonica TaxID=3369 RepID=UPI0024149C27|nr:UDP-rhamnose/UDP-galactose transporter 3 [Cryptomeria japonica]GLJ42144.1 hypothetical protein SUGI_0872750 [Cryptomeria japonica]